MTHQFKVGDRVRLKESERDYAVKRGLAGKVLTISQFWSDDPSENLVYFEGEPDSNGCFVFRLEPAIEPAPALIDAAKTYTTRDGRAVRIYTTDGFEDWQAVHGAVKEGDKWDVEFWFADGRGSESGLDLIEVKPEREVWINVYPDGYHGPMHKTREEIDKHAQPGRIACLHLKFREGEGL